MHSERVRYVLVPGWYGSEDAHWQSHWQRALPNASRVEQQDWITPQRAMHLARAWGAETVILPEAGHINVKSGHGAWEAGYRHLFRLQYLIDSQARRRA